MTLTVGMASSHFPSLFQDTYTGWQRWWERLSSKTPQPPEVALEDEACIADFVARRRTAFGRLRASFAVHRPDALIVIAGDQDEWFDPSHLPNVLIYAGSEEIVGFHNDGDSDGPERLTFWEHPERFGLRLHVDSALAETFHRGLVGEGFDVSLSRKIDPQGRRRAAGPPHALTRTMPQLMPALDVPVIPILLKTVEDSPAVLGGDRCLALGRAIGKICERLPQRLAIYGSGGMSHNPSGPRSGWVDETLDRWVMRCLASGDLEKLASLFSFRSATTDSGTGELRTWLVVAGAMAEVNPNGHAQVLDYFAARKATAGAGWVLWDGETGSPQLRA